MTDVESSAPPRAKSTVNNPYSANTDIHSPWHPINFMWRVFWMGGSLYLLDRMDAYHKIMHSPSIRHEWFKVGLAASVALMSVKAYVELYTGKLQKKEVSYEALPQLTHAAILLILLSGLAFHVAIWPEFGAASMFIMFLVGAFLLNFCLMFPTPVQNVTALVSLTFFLQEYQ